MKSLSYFFLFFIALFAFHSPAFPTERSLSDGAVYNVRDFGTKGDGTSKDTIAIQKSIDRCCELGGGTVIIPAGIYLCGSIHLKSHVTLHLDNGAVIRASTDESDFDPYETLDYKTDSDKETTYFRYSLFWGEKVQDVAIVGEGRIDGNRSKRGGPKPIAIKRGESITLRGITIVNAPNYCISLLGCEDVNIDGVTIRNAYCDGIDPDGCRRVRISNCDIESWDDAIVLKSSYALGERRSTEYVAVSNCILSTSCNAFKLGTESGGGFRFITADNLVMVSPPQKRPTLSGIALETVDGATVEGIAISNVSMQDVRAPIFLRLGNRGRDLKTPQPGVLRNVSISHVVAVGATLTSSIAGLAEYPVDQISLSDIQIEYRGGGAKDLMGRAVPELPEKYPEAEMFGELPAYGFYCRHARNLTLRDIHVWTKTNDERPALLCEDVTGLDVNGLTGSPAGGSPFILFNNVRDARLSACVAPPGTQFFLSLRGVKTANVMVTANNLSATAKAFQIAPEVPRSELCETGNWMRDH